MFPFGNKLISFEINGDELYQMMSIIQSGSKGLYHCAGLKQTITRRAGKMALKSLYLASGEEIIPSKNYRGVTIDFLLAGGDDFRNVMNVIYKLRKEKEIGELRSVMRGFLREIAIIKEGTLIDQNNRRITVID